MYQDDLMLTLGEVISTDDPEQLGRVKVYCSSLDSPIYSIESLPWANYASPFGGTIENMSCGPNEISSEGPRTYGWWSIPKVGSIVIVFALNSDPNVRYYAFGVLPAQSNRCLPAGRNYDESGKSGPFTDSYDPAPYSDNLKTAGLNEGDHYYTRGGYERQVAQAKTNKDGKEGYSKNHTLNDGSLESNTYCFTTPGGHFMSLQDSPEFCRIRFKTVTGRQVLLDDTNERIYISTAKGNNYWEMDDDGHINVYAKDDISYYTEGNFNVSALKDINLHGDNVHIKAKKKVYVTAVEDIHTSSKNLIQTAKAELAIKAQTIAIGGAASVDVGSGGKITIKGAMAYIQSTPAKQPKEATPANEPKITPKHEPWVRPASSTSRNKYWKA